MSRYTVTVEQISDGNGLPIVGAKKFFFESGTTTKKTIYSDSDFSTATNNPQISDSNGRFSDDIFLDGIYKEEQQDNSGTAAGYDGVTLWTKDPIGDVAAGQFTLWVSDSNYDIPEIVLGSDDNYYLSKTDANQGNDPVSTPSNWSLISFVKDGVLNLVTTIKDSNGNESIIITATLSAVNELTVANAATGNAVSISATGSDTNIDLDISAKGTGVVNVDIIGDVIGDVIGDITGTILDTNGNEVFKSVTTTNAVNELSATNSATGDGVSLTATGDDTNIDLNISAKGDGKTRINGDLFYGLILLDTPVLIATDTSTSATGNTPVDITAQTTGVATKAIINIYLNGTGGASVGDSEVLAGHGGETLTTIVHRACYGKGDAASDFFSDSNQFLVNLDSGEILDYSILQTGANPSSRTVKIYLAGYYI